MTESYTYKDEFGKINTIENIPSAEVDVVLANMRLLDSGATRIDALELWCFDHDKIGNAEADALTAKAKANGAGVRGKSSGKRKAPQRKPDYVKRAIVADLAEHVQSGVLADALASNADCHDAVSNVNVDNIERIVSFSIGGDTYTLTLAKKRKPKA